MTTNSKKEMPEKEPEILEIEIRNFELNYDGMYHIKWFEGKKEHRWFIYLDVPMLLRIIEIEGIAYSDIIEKVGYNHSIKFEKVVLNITKIDGLFEAWGFVDQYLGNTFENDGFTVELLFGDTLKNHKNEFLLASVSVKDNKNE